MSLRTALALVALAAACVGGVVIVSTLGPDGATTSARRPLRLATSIAPSPIFFGDLVTARAEVVVDRRLADPDSVRLDSDFAPYALVGAPRESRSESSSLTALGYRYTLTCLTEACLPRAGGIALPTLRVRAGLRGGGTAVASAEWPKVNAAPRVADVALTAGLPPWKLQLGLAPASYRVPPGLAAAALTGAAVALALVALALVGWELARRRRRLLERARRRSALARALALARESAAREPDDRRRALALLARVLAFDANGGRGLAPAAARLAWDRTDPSPAVLAALLDDVERMVTRP